MKWVSLLLLLTACWPEPKAATYGTQLQACNILPTEAEVDACMCNVALQYGRVKYLQQKGIQCSSNSLR